MQNNYASPFLPACAIGYAINWLLISFFSYVNGYDVNLLLNMLAHPNQLLLKVLEDHWKKYLTELKRCRAEFSNEAVHDVRVALRRLLSLIQLLNFIEPRPRLRKLSSAIKSQLDEFDDLRDTQVMLAEISETIHELPELEKFYRHLERVEKKLLKDLRKKIKNLDLKEVTRRVRKTRGTLNDDAKADFAEPIIRSVDDAFLVVIQRYEQIDPVRPSTIHRLRVAFKKFRYMIEIAHPLLDDFPPENFKRMHDYQSLMGEIQDADTFLRTLDDYQVNASSPTPEPIRRFYESRYADTISAYLNDKEMLNDFWRLSPDQTFPWEKTE
jgi:CHAD domain-containing protein